jgi:hypothetical protein
MTSLFPRLAVCLMEIIIIPVNVKFGKDIDHKHTKKRFINLLILKDITVEEKRHEIVSKVSCRLNPP